MRNAILEWFDEHGELLEKPSFYVTLFLFSVVLSLLSFPVGDVAQAGILCLAAYALFFTKEQLVEWRRKEIIQHCNTAFLEAEKIKDDVHVVISQSIGSGGEAIFAWFEFHGDDYLHEMPNIYNIKRELEKASEHFEYIKVDNDLRVFLDLLSCVIRISKYIKTNNISGALGGTYLESYQAEKEDLSRIVGVLFSKGSLDKDLDVAKYISNLHGGAIR